MRCVVKPGFKGGEVYIPPSKSETMRAIIFASMAKGTSYIENILQSPDTYSMIEGVKSFGAEVKDMGTCLEIKGVAGNPKLPKEIIDVGNSGLALRFLLALAALVDGEVLITGDESIRTRRPVKPLLDVYNQCGMSVISFDNSNNGVLSIKGKLKPGSMMLQGKDSQPVSSLLFATSFLDKPSEIFVLKAGEKPWVDLTMHWLELVGAGVYNQAYRLYEVEGNVSYEGFSLRVGGDYSTALFPIAAAFVTKKEIAIHGLDQKSMQGDKRALEIFRKMGAEISFDNEGVLKVLSPQKIKGLDVDINDCIDILPILAVVATFAESKTSIRGAEIAKFKESNRIGVMTEQLRKMGARIESNDDGMIIYPSKLKGAFLFGEKDHRVILSLIIAAIGAKGESTIDGIEASVKSYPTAIYDFIHCGVDINLLI